MRWITPVRRPGGAARRDEMLLVFPTIKHLERLDRVRIGGRDAGGRRGALGGAVQPRIVARDGLPEVLLPGEPGYDEA